MRGRSSVGRVLQWHCRGRQFESVRLHHFTPHTYSVFGQPARRLFDFCKRLADLFANTDNLQICLSFKKKFSDLIFV